MDRVFELRIEIERTNPVVWRQLVVPETITFYELHHTIQITFGWKNSHIYSFTVNDQTIGNPDLLEDTEVISDKNIFINQALKKKGSTMQYEYDFGDGWMHNITLENISENLADIKVPVCLEGEMACPPEDCGGIHGYEILKEAMKDKKHPEHDDLIAWLGKRFDPYEFYLQKVNKELKGLKKYIKEYESD